MTTMNLPESPSFKPIWEKIAANDALPLPFRRVFHGFAAPDTRVTAHTLYRPAYTLGRSKMRFSLEGIAEIRAFTLQRLEDDLKSPSPWVDNKYVYHEGFKFVPLAERLEDILKVERTHLYEAFKDITSVTVVLKKRPVIINSKELVACEIVTETQRELECDILMVRAAQVAHRAKVPQSKVGMPA